MLSHIVRLLVDRMRDERGATMVEYGLLVVLIALVAAAGAGLLGIALDELFADIAGRLAP